MKWRLLIALCLQPLPSLIKVPLYRPFPGYRIGRGVRIGFCLVTAEALASGRPVIGFSDCLGTGVLIEDEKNGPLIDPGSDKMTALADGLRRLMVDGALRMRLGQAGPASVTRFAFDAVINQWEITLEWVAKGGRSGQTDRDI